MLDLFYRVMYAVSWPLRVLMGLPMRFSGASQRMLSISLPARVALLVALFLVICVVIAFIAFFQTENRASWNYWVNPVRVTVILVLLVVIPLVVYQVLRLWLAGAASRYPDIDSAWRAGLAELKRCDLDMSQVPLFLVLGSHGVGHEKGVFDASRLNLRMREVPGGPAALHWYANADAIYLVLTDTCCLSRLALVAREATAEERSRGAPIRAKPAADAIRGTVVAGGPGGAAPSMVASGPLPAASAAGPDIRGTMVVGGGSTEDAPVTSEKRAIALPPAEVAEQEDRLAYVCQLLRRARRPLCPINGIVTLLPFEAIHRGPREGIEVERAVKRDLDTLRRVLMVRCPVTALVVGMEEESGFRELVRRVGRERATAQRFGKGFSIWNPPLRERLEALCSHACGSFEDWVYALFRERGSLSKPGNTKLFALLCTIRRNIQSRLARVLSGGFGYDPDEDPDCEPMLFGGCYFAATGETEDRQAFVKGVFDKLLEQQEELEWTSDALREDAKYQSAALGGFVLDTLLLAGLVGMMVYKWVLAR